MPDTLGTTFRPYDLVVPTHLLVPGRAHEGRGCRQQSVTIGRGDEAATLTVTRWDRCAPGCQGGSATASHDAGSDVRLRVPCDSLPHCNACECGDSHDFYLPPDKVAELKGILP